MASALDKRLARIEELLRDRIDTPVACVFLYEGEDPEQVLDTMVAAGKIAAADRDRVKFIRWLTAEEYVAIKPHSTWAGEIGPPRDSGEAVSKNLETEIPPARAPDPEPTPEQIARWKEAIAQREREIEQEKLDAAAAAFDRSIA